MEPTGARRPLTCLLVDDEPLALNVLAEYCAQVPFLELKGRFHEALAAVEFLQGTPVDLVFLDIHMPRLSGLQLAQLLPQPAPRIIFTTAHAQYAAASYELPALDYLLKPVRFERFVQAAHRAQAALRPAAAPTPIGPAEHPDEALFIRQDGRLHRVPVADLYYAEGQKEYLMLYSAAGRLLTLQSFRGLEEQLPPGRFVRIHKSYLINLRHLDFVERHRVQVRGTLLPLGETYRDAFLEQLRFHGRAVRW
ncbi:DNA-binding LytR/AlgR family response regulator [Hymenobacter luteus]|uniref:DNA-binding LytR/AlgR family response regulator n=2 Tax=Hymenobacter TaxID=89966 RepID=A0A7W9SYD8_9BACT|nr:MULTISPECIES: LytTR family DNA-binding domain-containing protein [Hymenobacter]MBB4599927.1 DNA-binding LytR/AlgR family response regulator [Hymenobacter latericoloratus]MBB6057763.1 DNA-binding LytR/AlgR family response regulator [Hymenobacter luteus]